jgi:gamma-glutamyl:cysteine ligase YbdK (ATP-grasp superfamily)
LQQRHGALGELLAAASSLQLQLELGGEPNEDVAARIQRKGLVPAQERLVTLVRQVSHPHVEANRVRAEVAGDAAILVDPHDAKAIASGIERVLTNEDLRRELRQKGLARAHQFSWEASVRRIREVYEKASA